MGQSLELKQEWCDLTGFLKRLLSVGEGSLGDRTSTKEQKTEIGRNERDVS